MSFPIPPFSGKPALAALLFILVTLHGCATPESLSEQVAPLQAQLVKLEHQQKTDLQHMQASAALARKQAEQAETRALALSNRLADENSTHHTRLNAAETNIAALASAQKHLADVLEQAMLATRQTTETALQRTEQTQTALQATENRLTQLRSTHEARLAELGEQWGERQNNLEKQQEKQRTELEAQALAQAREVTQTLTQTLTKNLTQTFEQAIAQSGETQREGQREALRNTLAQWQTGQQEQQAAQKKALEQLEERTNTRNDNSLKQAQASLNARLAQAEKRAADAQRMAEDAMAAIGLGPRKILGRVVRSITLTDDKTLFPLNSPDLGEKDIAKLNTFADYIKTLDANYHLSIHGYTDGFGSDDYNYELGKARAEVVKIYLNEKRGIPLLRMSVISHGGIGSTPGGKSNRRIVIDVLQ